MQAYLTIPKCPPLKEIDKKFNRDIDKEALAAEEQQLSQIEKHIEEGQLNDAVGKIEMLIQQAAKEKPTPKKMAKKWFDAECYREKQRVLEFLFLIKHPKVPTETILT